MCIFTAYKKIEMNENLFFFTFSDENCNLKRERKKYLMRWSNKFATFCFWMETVGASHFSLFFFFHHICEGEEEGLTQIGVRILAKRSILFPSLEQQFSSWNRSFKSRGLKIVLLGGPHFKEKCSASRRLIEKRLRVPLTTRKVLKISLIKVS